MADFEAVVVGAGHNGLVCAAYLARAGIDTLAVEARRQVGGCASTVSDLGARFNICNCDHTLVRAMPFMEELGLAEHGLRYVEADPAYVLLGYDGSPPWLFFSDVEATVESIARNRPAAAHAYRRYLQDALPAAEALLELTRAPATTRGMLRSLAARRGRGAARLARWSRSSALDVMRSYFDDDALVMPAMSTGPTVWGAPPDADGTGAAAAQYALRHLVKTGRPVGGSGALTDALAAAFVAAGGRLRCATAVVGLIWEGDGSAVRGVRLADGAEVTADAVIVASDFRPAALDWLGPARARSARRFTARARSSAPPEGYESKIDAVITAAPRYTALEQSGQSDLFGGRDPNEATFVVSPSPGELAEAHRLRALGLVSPRPTLISNVPSVLDPTARSDDGHHVLSLEVLFTPYSLQGGWSGSAEPQRWLEVWSSLLQPGLLDAVDRYRAMTPDRYERELLMERGHTPSYAASPLSSLLGMRRELSRHRGPVRSLFLSGAATFPGAGIWGAAGRNTARAVMQRLRR